MIRPEFGSVDIDREQQLTAALEGKDPYYVFQPGRGRGFDGPSAYNAFAYPDKFAMHKWSTDDDATVEYLGTRIPDGDNTGGALPEFFVLGEGKPETPGFPAKPDMKYRGLVERGDALDIALRWLDTYGSDEKFDEPAQDLDTVVGVLDGRRGAVLVTGIGAAIFGPHIQAMQERGEASFYPTGGESDSLLL